MFVAALIVVAVNWEQPKCPLMGECLNTHWYVHILEYYSAIKTNKQLT